MEDTKSAHDLMTISAKIYAIGELIKFRGGEPSLDEERVNYGIGELLTDLADELTNAEATTYETDLDLMSHKRDNEK